MHGAAGICCVRILRSTHTDLARWELEKGRAGKDSHSQSVTTGGRVGLVVGRECESPSSREIMRQELNGEDMRCIEDQSLKPL